MHHAHIPLEAKRLQPEAGQRLSAGSNGPETQQADKGKARVAASAGRLPGVERSNSMLVLRTVKKTTALPL